jgi:hypothetical protein
MILKRATKTCTSFIAISLAMIAPVFAYEYPLSSESIREAYFIGDSRNGKTADFMQQYTHRFPVPPDGPYIAEIRLETPFYQVVQRASQAVDYSAQDAIPEFLGKNGVFRLVVRIYFTPSYGGIVSSKDGKIVLRKDDFWREFKIRFVQGTEIGADSLRGEAIYATSEKGMRRLTGAEVEADYTVTRVRSESVKIEVLTPDAAKVDTSFDLSTLR